MLLSLLLLLPLPILLLLYGSIHAVVIAGQVLFWSNLLMRSFCRPCFKLHSFYPQRQPPCSRVSFEGTYSTLSHSKPDNLELRQCALIGEGLWFRGNLSLLFAPSISSLLPTTHIRSFVSHPAFEVGTVLELAICSSLTEKVSWMLHFPSSVCKALPSFLYTNSERLLRALNLRCSFLDLLKRSLRGPD